MEIQTSKPGSGRGIRQAVSHADRSGRAMRRKRGTMGSYIPATGTDREEMLSAIGIGSRKELWKDIPEEVFRKEESGESRIPEGKSELEVKRYLEALASENTVYRVWFRGAGAYRHYIPEIVNAVTSKEEFVTAYTPYQAEISQGVLQSIFEYQSMICMLTGMDAANASVYDGASAAAEAAAMCRDRRRGKVLVSETAHPDVIQVIKTYCFGNGMEFVPVPQKDGTTDYSELERLADQSAACFYLQQPNFYGILEDAGKAGKIIHAAGGKYIMGVNPISLGILKTPAEYGADIAVGEGQPLGMPVGFGGPYLGFMACVETMMRKLPGRIVGETVDTEGKRGFVLTLQAREQHIRREKASSNICSNEALCAMKAAVYLAAMGRSGLKEAAKQSASKAAWLQKCLAGAGLPLMYEKPYFHEFVTRIPDTGSKEEEDRSGKSGTKEIFRRIEEAFARRGILSGLYVTDGEEPGILWCCTELNTKEEIEEAAEIVRGCLNE